MSSEVDNNVTINFELSDDMNFTTISNEFVSESIAAKGYNQTIATTSTNLTDIMNSNEPDIALYSVLCIKGFIFGSIIIGAVLGNALVILAVRRNRKLRYVR